MKNQQELKNCIKKLIIECNKLNINLLQQQNKINRALESNSYHLCQVMRLMLIDLILKNTK